MIGARAIAAWHVPLMGSAKPADCTVFTGADDVKWTGPRFLVYTRTGGPGLTVEGLFDTLTVQVRIAGRANDYDDAEKLADAVDDAFLNAPLPTHIGGRYVMVVDRVGSPPAFDRRDAGHRTHFTANYLLSVSRI